MAALLDPNSKEIFFSYFPPFFLLESTKIFRMAVLLFLSFYMNKIILDFASPDFKLDGSKKQWKEIQRDDY